MKRSRVFWIVAIVLFFILAGNFLFHVFYFGGFYKNVRDVTDLERDRVIDVMREEMEIDGYGVSVLDVFRFRNRELARVELVGNDSRKRYFVDLEENKIIKK
jgi:hypothetical protein